jgi:DNA-binding response OmpR family regulator
MAMKKPGIVVIDDDPAINEALVMILRKAGYAVRSFLTAEAYEEADTQSPAAYIIDRQLPGSDGLDLCRRLKAHPTTSQIPVIIMSATPDARQYTQQAGGDHFLEKPFSKKQLLAVLERLVKTSGTQMSGLSNE